MNSHGPKKSGSNDILLGRCALFVKLMREHYPNQTFLAATVAQWGTKTYGESDTSGITSAVKLVYVLEYNAALLGIIPHREGGKLQFTLKQA
jgi:hypothetical protein